MLKLRYFYSVVFFLLHSITVFSQESDLNFTNLSSRQGLSSNNVNVILRDRYGYMWFGTDDGLNKFDGKQFSIYRHRDKDSTSIPSNEILDLFEDEKGTMWIGTGEGIVSYNRKMDSFINYNKVNGTPVVSVTSGTKDDLWLGVFGGLAIVNPKTNKTFYPDLKKQLGLNVLPGSATKVFKDKTGNIWLGTSGGLFRYSPKNNMFKRYLHYDNVSSSLAGNSISCFAEDRKGNIWVGTNRGLSMLAPGSDKFINYRNASTNANSLNSNIIYSIAVDQDNIVWVGTEEGLNILNPSNGRVRRVESDPKKRFSLVSRAVRSIVIDKENICWVATFRGGISKYDKNLPFFNYRQSNPLDPTGLKAPVVTSFAKIDNSGIYVGTDGGGLNLFNPHTSLFQHLPLSSSNKGKAVLAMESIGSSLWIGTYLDGLFIYDPKTRKSRQVTAGKGPESISGSDVFCIKEDSRGNVWIGTNGQGVSEFNASKKSFHQFSESEKGVHISMLSGYIRDIGEDGSGNIWIASRGGGITVYNQVVPSSYVLNKVNNGLPHNNVSSICRTSDGSMWVGTEGGLARYDESRRKFVAYREEDGLANEVIHKILEDNQGKIWASTNKGVSCLDPKSKKIRNYSSYNGLQQSPFVLGAGIRLADGTLFFGGTDGFNYVNPASLRNNRNSPKVVLTDLKISNRSVLPSEDAEIKENISIAREINLDYKQNFSLTFAALNFTSPHENKYLYKLERFDKDWNDVGYSNTAVYTNLDPGTYTFYVKAVSESGSWASPATSIVIHVHPPFWRTYYAYIIYIVLVGSLLWLIRRRGIRKLEEKFALQQERIQVQQMIEQERKEAERLHQFDELKIKFLTNLSHEFRTPISLILGPVEQLLHVETNSNKSNQLSMIWRNARRLLNLVNQLLDFRNIEDKELKLNPTEGDFIAFAKDVTESFKDLSERKQIGLVFQSTLRSYFTSFDHDKVERVLFNLLSNAFKFTLKGGTVTLRIERDNREGLKISILDNGIGIEEEAKEKIFERFFQTEAGSAILNQGSGIGLSIAREFVKMHGGSIDVESIAGEGSIFTIYFPFECLESGREVEYEDSGLNDSSELPAETPAEETLTDTNSSSQLPLVLLVEDNDDFRLYLRENLKTFYRIIEASNGKEGWQKVLSSHPDLVISDISMPYVSGIELCRKIKSDRRTSHIPVLLLTALTGEDDQLLGLETGANDYMTKPFNFEILNVKIRNLLALNEKLKSTYTKKIKVMPAETKIVSENEKLLSKAIKYIEDNLTDPKLSVEDLSRELGMSRVSLYSKILEYTGETPVEFIRSVKLDKAAILLEKSGMNVAQVGYSVGFATPSYFARAFRKRFNMLPTEYINVKKGNKE
ncbi:hybrid sensor histidine kinase/response regulator transcription factor [Desertivirga brevis]|uniref:hybrid sensor histidine kinase/response regulator transcription factor n=1 Tax=Desertivirga brevis TaxID=2810310 RepID=UPI001A95753B|nr:hybrid sensor histidine kinase/response regulator transcription factor [Pedobacter sp. SYSU D00873]